MKLFDGKTFDINATIMALGDKCIQLLHLCACYRRLRQRVISVRKGQGVLIEGDYGFR